MTWLTSRFWQQLDDRSFDIGSSRNTTFSSFELHRHLDYAPRLSEDSSMLESLFHANQSLSARRNFLVLASTKRAREQIVSGSKSILPQSMQNYTTLGRRTRHNSTRPFRPQTTGVLRARSTIPFCNETLLLHFNFSAISLHLHGILRPSVSLQRNRALAARHCPITPPA